MQTANRRPEYLSEEEMDRVIVLALAEDLRDGDVTTLATLPKATAATATFVAKEGGVLAGCEVVSRVLHALDARLQVTWHRSDGDRLAQGEPFGEVSGSAQAILSAERTALNLMQRMSGIATAARRMVEAVQPYGTRILDTRKTAPGLRLLDKWAVRIGGGHNHRIGLFDMILIKDNHIAAAGGLGQAVEAAQRYRAAQGKSLVIEVEARTLDEVDELLGVGGVEIVLLDNMVRVQADGALDVSLLEEAVRRIGGRFQTEASGNVTESTVSAIAATGVDAISSGALTHSVKALDISLLITLDPV
jgi:nicotinate-nucleotide pyrophosphorylase (carboxylating)